VGSQWRNPDFLFSTFAAYDEVVPLAEELKII
jgi:hypothetical protein